MEESLAQLGDVAEVGGCGFAKGNFQVRGADERESELMLLGGEISPQVAGSVRARIVKKTVSLFILTATVAIALTLWLAWPSKPGVSSIDDRNFSSLASSEPKLFQSFGYMLKGYSIFKGNPLANRLDPGFRQVRLFSDDDAKHETYDLNLVHPEGTVVHQQDNCYFASSTEVLKDTKSLTKKMLAMVGADVTFVAPFSANSEYSNQQKVFQESTTKTLLQTSECKIYYMKRINNHVISKELKDQIADLPKAYGDGGAFFKFLDDVGSHYVEELIFGARDTIMGTLAEKDMRSQSAMEAETGGSAGDSMFSFKSSSRKKHGKFENVANYEEHSLGPIPEDGDRNAWKEKAEADPYPIEYKLASITDLIRASGDPSAESKASNVKKAMENYCIHYLKKTKTECDVMQAADVECTWNADCGDPKTMWCREHKCEHFWPQFHLELPETHGVSGVDTCYSRDEDCLGRAMYEDECKAFAKKVGKGFHTEDTVKYPAGCYQYGFGHVYFNKNEGLKIMTKSHLFHPFSVWREFLRDPYTITDQLFGGMPVFRSARSAIYYCAPKSTWFLTTSTKKANLRLQTQSDHCFSSASLPADMPLFNRDARSNIAINLDALTLQYPGDDHRSWTHHRPATMDVSKCDQLVSSNFPGHQNEWMNTRWKPYDSPHLPSGAIVYHDAANNYLYFCKTYWVMTNSFDRVQSGTNGETCHGWAFSTDAGILGSLWYAVDLDTDFKGFWPNFHCLGA